MSSKTSYTDRDVIQLLQALSQERKRSATLNEELSEKMAFEEENHSLAQQILRLKSFYQEQLETSRSRIEELETLIANAPSTEGEHLDAEKLKRQALESTLVHVQMLHGQLQKQKENGDAALEEERLHSAQLEKVMGFLRQQVEKATTEENRLRKELDETQQKLAEQQQNVQKADQSVQQQQGQIHDGENQRQKLERNLVEKSEALAACERELGLIKQTLLRGLKEVKELEARYEEAVKEKIATAQKFQQSHFQVERFREQADMLEEQLSGALLQVGELQPRVVQLEEVQRTLNTSNEHLQEKLNASFNQNQVLLQELTQLKTLLFEKEGDLLQAQQHLAKKVKEVSTLEDKNEEYKVFVSELQQVQSQSRIKLAELQTTAEFHVSLQKKLEEQQQELNRSHETHIAKWEEKYFAVYEKWQSAEARVKELEKLEERHKQLHGLWANLGTALSVQGENLPLATPVQEAPKPQPPIAKPISTEPQPRKNNSLFDRTSTPKTRQTFLE